MLPKITRNGGYKSMSTDFSKVEFTDGNPEPRCPCVLLLDTSYSMDGNPIDKLNVGIQSFKHALMEDDLAMLRVEVSIIKFGGSVNIIQDFITADEFIPPVLSASGDTPMGNAINLALDKIQEQKQLHKASGRSYFRPWIFMITDGAPTDGNAWRVAAQKVKENETNDKVVFFAVGVEGANMDILRQISTRQPLKLKGLNFREMFLWLSRSLTKVSNSKPGEKVDLESPLGWGQI